MIDRVIVAYDGSELAREAFSYALAIAEAAGIEIVGLHAVEPAPAPAMVADPVAGFDPNPILARAAASDRAECEAERERFRAELAALGEQCAPRGVRFSARIEEGRLIDAIVRVAGPADLIAVGLKGRFSRAGFGSTTKSLVQRGPCPVMVVSGAQRPMNRVLGVWDGSERAARAIAWCRDLAVQTGWALSVLAVLSKAESAEEAIAGARAQAPAGAQIVHFGAEGADEAKQIEAAAAHAASALLVVPAFADSWLHQFFFGGTTGHVLARVNAPVVLAH